MGGHAGPRESAVPADALEGSGRHLRTGEAEGRLSVLCEGCLFRLR